MAQLHLSVVTPEATVRDEPVDYVVVPLFDGEIGIAPGHSPMIGRLGFGELRYRQGEKTIRYYVDGGFVQVTGVLVSVLTNRALLAETLDPAVIAEQLAAARARPASGPDEMALRDRSVQQARAQLRVAQHKHSGSRSGGHH